jgi:hypothetical protein
LPGTARQPVPQTGSLPYRGLAISRLADCRSAKQQILNLRYAGQD